MVVISHERAVESSELSNCNTPLHCKPENGSFANKLHNISFSAHSIQGKRSHMEDYFNIGYQKKPCEHQQTLTDVKSHIDYYYFGVFDGHGGCSAADYTRNHLLRNITGLKEFWSNDDQDVLYAIKQGFLDTQADMLDEMYAWPRHTNNSVERPSPPIPSTAGTTASVLFIKNNKYYTGHVGDSRIVIARENPNTRNWIARDLTTDHKPESKAELARIKDAGGLVKAKVGVHRVVWRKPILFPNYSIADHEAEMHRYPLPEEAVLRYIDIPFLAIARSLGDFWSYNPNTDEYIVSPEPDVACEAIDPNDKGIILASDGLWNVMHSTLAVRMLQQFARKRKGISSESKEQYQDIDNYYCLANDGNSAQALVELAYQIWEWKTLKSDNITAVVVRFDDESFNSYPPKHDEICSECFCSCPSQGPIDNRFMKSLEKPVIIDQEFINYYETIYTTHLPKFEGEVDYTHEELKFYSESNPIARLPPSISYLDPPKNYQRLADSKFRKIINTAVSEHSMRYYGISLGIPPSIWILIANVTDDPDDLKSKQIRVNANKKLVCDSSCQATQPLHDFGQPWKDLMTYDSPDDDSSERDSILDDVSDSEHSEEEDSNSPMVWLNIQKLVQKVKHLEYKPPDAVSQDVKSTYKHPAGEEIVLTHYKKRDSNHLNQDQRTEINLRPRSPKRRKTLMTSDDENRLQTNASKNHPSASPEQLKKYKSSPSSSNSSLLKMRLRSRKSAGDESSRPHAVSRARLTVSKSKTKSVLLRAKSWQTRASVKIRKINKVRSSSSVFVRKNSE